jgi:hypothetical protein
MPVARTNILRHEGQVIISARIFLCALIALSSTQAFALSPPTDITFTPANPVSGQAVTISLDANPWGGNCLHRASISGTLISITPYQCTGFGIPVYPPITPSATTNPLAPATYQVVWDDEPTWNGSQFVIVGHSGTLVVSDISSLAVPTLSGWSIFLLIAALAICALLELFGNRQRT